MIHLLLKELVLIELNLPNVNMPLLHTSLRAHWETYNKWCKQLKKWKHLEDDDQGKLYLFSVQGNVNIWFIF